MRGIRLVSPHCGMSIAIGAIDISEWRGPRYIEPRPSDWQIWLDKGWQWVDDRIPPEGWAYWFASGDQLH